jgi:hypothetical protein
MLLPIAYLQCDEHTSLAIMEITDRVLPNTDHLMYFLTKKLGLRGIPPIEYRPQVRQPLGMHRYGLAPRGEPVVFPFQTTHTTSYFLLQTLNSPHARETILANPSLTNALSMALFRKGYIQEADALLRAAGQQYTHNADETDDKLHVRSDIRVKQLRQVEAVQPPSNLMQRKFRS